MNHKRVLWLPLSVCVLAFLLIFLNGAASRIEAAPLQDEVPVSQSALSCRYGVNTTHSSQVSWLEPLGASWYLDFNAHTPYSLTNAEFVQVIRVRQNKVGCDYVAGYTTSPSLTKEAVGSIAASNRGALWIIGNEPDRGPNPEDCLGQGQDDTMPEVYAQAYHDAYAFIKSFDPTARVANAGLVEVTPGRLQYLDKVWQAYLNNYGGPMPVDVWNFHLYILPEAFPNGQPNGLASVALGTDPALGKRESGGSPDNCADPNVYCIAEHDSMTIFTEQVVAMRTWMKEHGQQNKPLVLSEYSLLYAFEDYDDPVNPTTCWLMDEYRKCFTAARVQNFMTQSFDYLDSASDPALGYPADGNRLVQRWLWFAVHYAQGAVYNLVDDSGTALTPVGERFQSSVAGRSTYVNLRPDPIPPLFTSGSAGVATASLSVNVHNAGTAPTGGPFTATFYSDEAMTQPIGSAVIASGLTGCETRRVTATVSWPNLAVGSYTFWVRIDSGNDIIESDESDNVTSGIVTVFPYRLMIPLTFRSQ